MVSEFLINIMQESITTEVEVNLNGECRMAAFARGVNRGVNNRQVTALAERMLAKGYRRGEVVQVMRAEDALARESELQLVDQWGEPIKAEEAALYLFVVDGQHRIMAAAEANTLLAAEGKECIKVPAVEVELTEGETVAQYIRDINSSKEAWSTADYALSAHTAQQNPLLERYAALMKSPSNPEGLTLTVLNRLYCDGKTVSGADIRLLAEGRTVKGKHQKSVLPSYNVERGNARLTALEAAGLTRRDMNRKFVLDVMSDLTTEYSQEVAVKAFEAATEAEVNTMRNKRGVLDEASFVHYMRERAKEVAEAENKMKENEITSER